MASKDERKLARMFKAEILEDEVEMRKIYQARYVRKHGRKELTPEQKIKHNAGVRKWKAENKEHIAKYNKEYLAKKKGKRTPEEIAARLLYSKEYRKKNKARIAAGVKKRYDALTPEQKELYLAERKVRQDRYRLSAAERGVIYRAENSEKIKAYKKQWRLDNQDKVKGYSKKHNDKVKAEKQKGVIT